MKKLTRIFAGIFIAASVFYSCSTDQKAAKLIAAGLSPDTMQLATARMQEYVDSGKLAGISALIYKNGEIVYSENFGFADIEQQKPITDSTIYRIFSMTKPVTAVALMTLFDEGKFQLDDPVSKYIPEFEGTQVYNAETKTLEPQETPLSIRHLLTHTSGIPYGWDRKAYVDSLYRVTGVGDWDGTLAEKMKALAGLPLKNQPGKVYEYGLGIDVAGYLVEILSGEPLDQFMKTRIFDPLNMDDTGFFVPENKHHRFSTLYTNADGVIKASEQMKDAFKTPVTLFSGGGGLLSTMDDYLNFCKMLLNKGELNGVRILQESTVDLIMSDQLPEGAFYSENKGYGLAGETDKITGDYGWSGAASTTFRINRENQQIVIMGAQFMPATYVYAADFRKILDSATMK